LNLSQVVTETPCRLDFQAVGGGTNTHSSRRHHPRKRKRMIQ
jgi:hypothetical protein